MTDWMKEFRDFDSAREVKPPVAATEKIQAYVHQQLNPSGWNVFSKISLIHLITGTLTLTACPQFGINIFPGHGLMHYFMRFGEAGCMLACGAVFLGGTLLAASLLLRPEEIRVMRRSAPLQVSTLAVLSMAALICAGASVITTLAAAWIVGSIIGGLITMEVGWQLRRLWRKRAASPV